MDETSGQSLDPFEFHGHPTSSIPGLGGEGPLPDPSYAFHTSYVSVGRGHAHFMVRFKNLKARRGSLVLRIHMLPDEPGAVASLVTSHRLQLNWLAHRGGETQLRFEAFRGARYAIMGLVPDQLDASADELTVMLDRPATAEDLAAQDAIETRSTGYGSDTIRSVAVPLLLSLDQPSFAQPVSQACTSGQLREPAFRMRCGSISDLPADQLQRWQIAYILQALDRYGVLQPGACGLILGAENGTIERAIAVTGASCRHVNLNPDREIPSAPTAIEVDDLPGDLFAFDFLLSMRATDKLHDSRQAVRFIERAMECLRPGGLAVNIVGYHPAPRSLPIIAFDRNGLEQIAVALISRGHQMARLKVSTNHIVGTDMDSAIPFGLITRRASLIR